MISVIIPFYNAEKYLEQTINAVLSQTYSHFELILINDGSADNSENIINAFTDSRIRYFKQENKGTCAASNFGILKSEGDYIKFLDADDIVNPEHLQEQLKTLDGSASAVASCAWGRFYNNDPLSAAFDPESVWKNMLPLDWLKASLKQEGDMMSAWVWLIPKEVLQKAGCLNERLSLNNDFEFSVRLLLNATEVRFAENAKLYYRSGLQNSLAGTVSEKAFSSAFLSTQLGCKHLLATEYSEEVKRLCANRYQQWVYTIYPNYPKLLKNFTMEIEKLGGSNLKLKGSKTVKFLEKIFGWKMTKLFQKLYYSVKYS
ncbi:hypothetical protein BH09BAC2_BH09BAC2_15800 [soil metagenome]